MNDADVLRARAEALAAPLQEGDDRPRAALLIFSVAGERYGVAAEKVREVRPLRQMTRLPHSPAALHGIMRVRSDVVGVFDLPHLLGVPAEPGGASDWVVVLDDGQRCPFGLTADSVEGVDLHAVDDLDAAGAPDAWGIAVGVLPDGTRVLDALALLGLPPPYQPAAGARPDTTVQPPMQGESGTP